MNKYILFIPKTCMCIRRFKFMFQIWKDLLDLTSVRTVPRRAASLFQSQITEMKVGEKFKHLYCFFAGMYLVWQGSMRGARESFGGWKGSVCLVKGAWITSILASAIFFMCRAWWQATSVSSLLKTQEANTVYVRSHTCRLRRSWQGDKTNIACRPAH